MNTYYLFSGFNTKVRFYEAIAESLKSNIIDKKSLVLISSSPSGHFNGVVIGVSAGVINVANNAF